MRNFYYALKQVFKLRWTNLTKLLSITLGIVISGALLCRVAWEQSYDSTWRDVENLHCIQINWQTTQSSASENDEWNMQIMAPIAPTLKESMPQIQAITRFMGAWETPYKKGDVVFNLDALGVDTMFFEVFDVRILEGGDPHKLLLDAENIMISQSTAEKLFPAESAIGKQLTEYGNSRTIQAVFEDFPRNTIFKSYGLPDVIKKGGFRKDWNGGDSYRTFMRVDEGTDMLAGDKQINEIIRPRFDHWAKDAGITLSFRTKNIRELFYEEAKNIDMIMSLLALALILIAGLNFALLSITSLASRAKEVGVHKASGASSAGIFSLIIWETVIYTVLAVTFAAVLTFGCKPYLEQVVGLFSDVFALRNMWAIGVMLLVMIVVAGVIPAFIFSRIPVTQVFRRFTATKASWKQGLLFVQFAASIFVICFTLIILEQYHAVAFKNLGYRYDNLVSVQLSEVKGDSEQNRQALMNELMNNSKVEAVAFSSTQPYTGMSGTFVEALNDPNQNFSSRIMQADSTFYKMIGISLIEGTPYLNQNDSLKTSSVIVNRELLRRLNIPEPAVGQQFITSGYTATISGVLPDFQTGHALYNNTLPLVVFPRNTTNYNAIATLRLASTDDATIKELQTVIDRLYPDTQPQLFLWSEDIKTQYEDQRMFRDGVVLASVVLIIITIMGIIGYISTETRRRAKEIAIRKIHGASATSVVAMLARNIIIVALIASAMGIPAAYIIGGYWQQDFVVQAPMSWDTFTIGTLVILLTVAACVTLQTWRIANANPAKSIKTE